MCLISFGLLYPNQFGKTDRVNRPLVRVISMIQLYIYFYTLNLTFCFRPPGTMSTHDKAIYLLVALPQPVVKKKITT
jgi:hypothetical protein